MASRKLKAPPLAEPLKAVILAVDTAQRSGWCVYVDGKYASSGEVDMLDPSKSSDQWGVSGWDADRVCLHALAEAAFDHVDFESIPHVMVYERPFRGTTQGQWIGAWKAAWVANSGHKRRMIGVYPSSWRACVLGPGWARAGRAQVRRMEYARAQALVGRTVGGDEGTAVLIAEWAARSQKVLDVLPKRRTRKVA